MTSRAVRKAEEADKRAQQARRAYELRQQGKSWWAVAEELGVSESLARQRVDDAITAAVAMADDQEKRALLAMEVGRMDALQEAYWATAVGGDVRAAELVLKISAQRAKLLGLDNIGSAATSTHTVIVQGTSPQYIEALRRAAAPKEITSG